MTTSVRLCLSYGHLKWDLIAFNRNIILIRKCIVDRDVVSDVTCTRQGVITCGHTIFSSPGPSPGRAVVLPPASALANSLRLLLFM